MDKLSYALGLSMGHNFLGSGIKSLNIEDFARGVEAVYKQEKPEISFDEAKQIINEYFTNLQNEIAEENKRAEVFLKPEEVSLAIGKGGMNIKLASMLTEYTIDVYRELDGAADEEDIYLDEFRDEIDEWVIDAIKGIGIDTAKGVLNAPREMLIEKADLEEDTVDEVLRILKAEFEE